MSPTLTTKLIVAAAASMPQPLTLMAAVRDEHGDVVDFRWTFINQAGERQLQIPAADIVGRSLRDLLPGHENAIFSTYKHIVDSGEPFIGKEIGYSEDWGKFGSSPHIYNVSAIKCEDSVATSWTDITEIVADRHRAHSTNRRLAVYEDIVERAGIGIWVVDKDGATTYVNDAMSSMLGYPREHIIGRQRHEFTPAGKSAEIPFDSEHTPRPIVEFRNASGESVWAVVGTTPMSDTDGEDQGNFIIVSDVTDEVHARREQQAAQLHFEEATAKAPIGQAIVTLDGRFAEVNDAYCNMLGYSREEIIGRSFLDITYPADVGIEAADQAALLSGTIESFDCEKRYVNRDGSPVWARVFISLIRKMGGLPKHFVAQAINIDPQKSAEAAAAAAFDGLEYRSTHDPLTELPNRTACFRVLNERLRNSPDSAPISVLFIDVDHFKEINDGVSHLAGDTVLIEMGQRIRSCVGDRGAVSRLGGDEFAVVTDPDRSVDSAEAIAEHIRTSIANAAFLAADARVHVTASIGIAQAHSGSTPQSLLSEADMALYQAKNAGRNRCAVANREMLNSARQRLELLDQMYAGVEADEFHAWYQPLVDLSSRSLVGHEALARWVRGGQPTPAATFIALAEESGLIHDIGASVIKEAISRVASTDSELMLAVNASPNQLQAPTFAARILGALAQASADPRRIAVEITEQALLRGGTTSNANIAALHHAGIKLYVDDFGVGYSSLATLRDYPIHGIKLDRSFSMKFDDETDTSHLLVSGLSQFAEHLGLDRIAEGIETENQLDYLVENGWKRGQGFLFGRAAPPERAGTSSQASAASQQPRVAS